MRLISIAISINLFMLTYAQHKEVNLLFVGDAMQHMPQVEAAKTDSGYNYDSCFYLLKDKISSADIACVNFETTLGGTPYRGYPMFSSPDQFAATLKDIGFDIFFLANNHILDSGQKGLERTIDVLDSLKVKHLGAYKSKNTRGVSYPLMVIKNGIRIAFLNYTYGTNGIRATPPNIVNYIDTTLISRDIKLAELHRPDIIIANMHWGDEYITYPNKEQKEVADFLIKNGVRIIIGHHPHVVQPLIKNVEDNSIKSVVYFSLGNFISNQRKLHTDGGAIAEINIRLNNNDDIEIISSSYSLVWVSKQFENKKPKYTLIPNYIEQKPNLTDNEAEAMNTFYRNAQQIIERR